MPSTTEQLAGGEPSVGPRVVVVSSIAPPDFGGGGLSAYKLAARLLHRGDLAFLVTRTTPSGRKERRYRDLQGLPELPSERVERVAPQRAARGWARAAVYALDLACLAATTARLLWRRRDEYDVLHCFTANWLSFFAICVGRLLHKRTVLELTLLGRDDPGARLSGNLLGTRSLMKRLQFRMADALICISPALVSRCAEAGIPPEKVYLVPRPVDPNHFRPGSKAEADGLAHELGLAGRWPIILFVGGISRRKGADLLLPVLRILARRHPGVVLMVVGTPDEPMLECAMREEIRREGLDDAVRFVERTGRINEYMRVATVFLLPTRREGFANVIVEAMASGLPVVVRLIPGITNYIIRDGEDGVLVSDGDPAAFARPILELLSDDGLRRRVSESARATACGRFRTEIIDADYQNLYDSLDLPPRPPERPVERLEAVAR